VITDKAPNPDQIHVSTGPTLPSTTPKIQNQRKQLNHINDTLNQTLKFWIYNKVSSVYFYI